MKATCIQGPTVSVKRWGFLLITSLVLAAAVGCAGGRGPRCGEPLSAPSGAAVDSLGLADFLGLAPAERSRRRERARRLVREGHAAATIDGRLGRFTTAAGLAPDDPDLWLAVAEHWRWLGMYLPADVSLDNAALAVRSLATNPDLSDLRGPTYKESAALQTALQRAWLHYDRAEWRDAMPWVKAALLAESGNRAALQIRGLLEARLGNRGMAHEIAGDLQRKDEFTTDIAWIMAALDFGRGNHRAAFSYFLGLRPAERAAAECYRDMGQIAEQVGEWEYARRWYRESAAAVPYRDLMCLTKLRHAALGDESDQRQLPFWVAFGRSYVTGSRSAYLAYAYEAFSAATTASERDAWAGLVVNAAGICLRLEMQPTAARRVRGLVFARTERPARAFADLGAALGDMSDHDPQTAAVAAEMGHLLLLAERHAEAIGYLRRALRIDRDTAPVWSDLGLALIMAGERQAAEEALTRAILLDSTLTTAWYNRGLMYLHAGDLDRAESDLGEAARLAPSNMEVANLLQQVRQQRPRNR